MNNGKKSNGWKKAVILTTLGIGGFAASFPVTAALRKNLGPKAAPALVAEPAPAVTAMPIAQKIESRDDIPAVTAEKPAPKAPARVAAKKSATAPAAKPAFTAAAEPDAEEAAPAAPAVTKWNCPNGKTMIGPDALTEALARGTGCKPAL